MEKVQSDQSHLFFRPLIVCVSLRCVCVCGFRPVLYPLYRPSTILIVSFIFYTDTRVYIQEAITERLSPGSIFISIDFFLLLPVFKCVQMMSQSAHLTICLSLH
jgi:hypothetical protein